MRSRFFRALVCLLLVCCILVNCSPIRAKASAIVAGLTVYEVLGYLTLILGITAGAVQALLIIPFYHFSMSLIVILGATADAVYMVEMIVPAK